MVRQKMAKPPHTGSWHGFVLSASAIIGKLQHLSNTLLSQMHRPYCNIDENMKLFVHYCLEVNLKRSNYRQQWTF